MKVVALLRHPVLVGVKTCRLKTVGKESLRHKLWQKMLIRRPNSSQTSTIGFLQGSGQITLAKFWTDVSSEETQTVVKNNASEGDEGDL